MKYMNTFFGRYFALVIGFCLTIHPVRAEDYETGIGIRLGGLTQGLTVKHFINTNSALEGILSFGNGSVFINGLYEKQTAIANAPGLSWFYGGGAHIGFYNDNDYFYYKNRGNKYYYSSEGSAVFLGIDMILGLEYKFQKAPITIGLDIKPFFDFVSSFPGYWDGALSARFAF